MILKCTYCNGKMRVDEKSIPDGKWVKVKCPHCSGIGLAGRQRPGDGAIPGHDVPAPPPATTETAIFRSEPPVADGQPERRTPVGEPSLPRDAFRDFSFPAETKAAPVEESPRKTGKTLWIVAWIGASLAIIIFFALVVNLVLPGPLK